MTEQNTTDETGEREELKLTIPLDPAHRRMDAALREELSEQSQVSVEKLVAQQVTPEVEQTLYQLLQQFKYSEE